jgi:hypothetical protein
MVIMVIKMKTYKKGIIGWIISALLFSGTLTIQASITDGILNLPTEPVTMTVYDNQVISYFDTYLSNVPEGYDVANGGPYLGWCVETGTGITRGVGHQIMLYSSYDPAMPESFTNADWYKINYILNHKIGSEDEISIAIWYFCGEWPYGMPPNSQTMVNEANLYGDGYYPPEDGVIAVLADGGSTIQRSIFELSFPPEYEGLTPGFWKNHLDAWQLPYNPNQPNPTLLGDVFTSEADYFPEGSSLLQALQFPGGPSLAGAARILLRAAVAALLNAVHPDVNYPLSDSEIISQVNNALNSMNRNTMLNLASTLDSYNNLGCDDL